MKVVIAGASGFIGKALVKELYGAHSIIGLSRSHHSDKEAKCAKRCICTKAKSVL
jgi:nucleoside-diphosphate-sugar epimerase